MHANSCENQDALTEARLQETFTDELDELSANRLKILLCTAMKGVYWLAKEEVDTNIKYSSLLDLFKEVGISKRACNKVSTQYFKKKVVGNSIKYFFVP